MKIAIISFGHADMTISMARYISLCSKRKIDLFFVFSQDKKKNNIIDLENVSLSNGIQSNSAIQKRFSVEIKEYLQNHVNLKLFIYKNLKFKSFSNWWLSIKFTKLLSSYDIIHFNGDHAVIMQLVPFLKRKKIVFTIHDLYPHSGEGKINRIQKIIRNYQIKSKSQLILQNKTDYNSLENNNPEAIHKIHFIPFGKFEIYKNYQFNNIGKRNFTSDILFFGRISKYKGIEYLLKSFMKVKENIPDAKLIIAGGGEYPFNKETYKNEANIIFENRFIPTDELTEYIKNTKLVVCPYTDATQSGVAMTAFAFNIPVIASNISGFKDVINENNGILVTPKNIDELSNAIISLLKNETLRKKLSENIKNDVGLENFEWNHIAKQIVEVYNKSLKL